MKICLVGDVFLGGDIESRNLCPQIKVASFNSADYRVANLEQAISETKHVEDKATLYSSTAACLHLDNLKFNALSVANNHIHDKGTAGISETLETLTKMKINATGAGATISHASKPVQVTDNLYLLSYCDFDKDYLNQVQIANCSLPGCNPLREEKITMDLCSLPKGSKAILFFHWGKEHVFFPPYHDIALAKNLLAHEQVALIVGTHSHRPQGFVKHKGKYAFFSLGNFLFPNFHFSSPVQLENSPNLAEPVSVTRLYHSVNHVTYKKWKLINRLSIVVCFDIPSCTVSYNFTLQDDCFPTVREASKLIDHLIRLWVMILSLAYNLPEQIYKPLSHVMNSGSRAIWNLELLITRIKNEGFRSTIGRISRIFLRYACG